MLLHPYKQSECMLPFPSFLTGDDCRTVSDDIYQNKKTLCRIPAAVKYNLLLHGKAAEVIIRRATMNRLATASQERTQGESESYACAHNSTKHIQSVLPTEKLQKCGLLFIPKNRRTSALFIPKTAAPVHHDKLHKSRIL